MRLDHTFTVPATVETAWDVLLDVPGIAPCMPGATLTEFDGEKFAGTVKVKLGPVTLTYRGTGRFAEVDEAARRVVLEASGKETRGSGTAAARVTAVLVPDGDTTRVDVGTDLTITGRPAQFGRGMISDVGERLIGQFAGSLATKLGESGESGKTTPAEPGPADREPAAARATSGPGPAEEPEPIDLLAVTGAAEKLRKYAVPAAAVTLGVIVLIQLIRRRRHLGSRRRGSRRR